MYPVNIWAHLVGNATYISSAPLRHLTPVLSKFETLTGSETIGFTFYQLANSGVLLLNRVVHINKNSLHIKKKLLIESDR